MLKWLLVLSALTFASTSTARAGDVQLRDEVGVISGADIEALQVHALEWPFELRLLVSNGGDLQGQAHVWLDAPNVIVVAVSPRWHRLETRFGVGTHVPLNVFDRVSATGKPYFKQGDWIGGARAIGDAAAVAARQVIASPVPIREHVIAMAPVTQESHAWFWVMLACALLLVTGAVWFVVNQRRERKALRSVADDLTLERDKRARNYASAMPERASYEPVRRAFRESQPVYVPSPQPVHVHHDHGSDMLTGMLIGSALNNHSERVVEHHHHEPAPAPIPYDSGNSGSSWDLGGSSVDFGSSDVNNGGGFDSGGSSDSF